MRSAPTRTRQTLARIDRIHQLGRPDRGPCSRLQPAPAGIAPICCRSSAICPLSLRLAIKSRKDVRLTDIFCPLPGRAPDQDRGARDRACRAYPRSAADQLPRRGAVPVRRTRPHAVRPIGRGAEMPVIDIKCPRDLKSGQPNGYSKSRFGGLLDQAREADLQAQEIATRSLVRARECVGVSRQLIAALAERCCSRTQPQLSGPKSTVVTAAAVPQRCGSVFLTAPRDDGTDLSVTERLSA
jgi:hypothetical protein